MEQKEAVESFRKGRDVFGVLPTGFGKKPDTSAVCYGVKQSLQLAKCFSQAITIIIICPLKSIMEEQTTPNEFGLSGAELHFDGETLNSIMNGEV